MTTGGWIVMLLSVSSVLTLLVFCLRRVLTLPPVEEEHVQTERPIDTGDTEDAD